MKASLAKLRRFALNKKSDGREKMDVLLTTQLDELVQVSRDMQAMRDCYESLCSAAAATANSAYKFSESLGEMGFFLLKKTTLHNDRGTGKILSMLGKVQLQLQEIVDIYRSRTFLAITSPSESLLNELRTVENMKRQCDEKRDGYEYMMAQVKGNGRSKSGKGKTFTLQQLQTAHDEFNDEAALCTFRLKSLKKRLSQSLLTQAARHCVAQLELFRKGLASLEEIEQHVRLVADVQDTYCHLSRLRSHVENDDGDINDEDTIGCGESDRRGSSHSAQLFTEERHKLAEKFRQTRESTMRNSNTYVLPLPPDPKRPLSFKTTPTAAKMRPSDFNRSTQHMWHSSPLEQIMGGKDSGASGFSKTNLFKAQPATSRGSNKNNGLLNEPPLPRFDISAASDDPKIKRQAFSGPFLRKSSPTKPREVSPRLSPHRHSAPLMSRNQDASATNKYALPLPTPPSVIPRSLSFGNIKPVPNLSHVAYQTDLIRGKMLGSGGKEIS